MIVFVLDGQTAMLAFVLAFFVALSFSIDWCFCPRTRRQMARLAARKEAHRADYRRRLIEASNP